MKHKVVLLHGFLGSSKDWDFHREHLQDFECYTPSLEELDHSSLEACTRSLHDYVIREVQSNFSLIGYSLGGRLALHFALEHPELLRSLIILGANPGIEDTSERLRRLGDDVALSSVLEEEGMESFLSRWYAQPLFTSLVQKREVFDAVLERRRDGNARTNAAILRGLSVGAQAPLWGRLREIKIRTLLLAGERDTKYLAISNRIASLLPNVYTATIASAGHALHLEAPITTLQEISKFLNRTPVCS